jgi:hypothetical protein
MTLCSKGLNNRAYQGFYNVVTVSYAETEK